MEKNINNNYLKFKNIIKIQDDKLEVPYCHVQFCLKVVVEEIKTISIFVDICGHWWILVAIGGGGGEETLIEEVAVTTKPIIFFFSYFKPVDQVS